MPITSRPRVRRAARVLLAPYLVALLLITWLPEDDAGRVTGIVATLARALEPWGIAFEIGYPVLEFFANIALFVPFGMLLALAWPPLRLWQIALLGFALSGTIELVQILLPTRYPTVSDVLANTAGSALGALIIVRVHAMLSRRRSTLES